MKLPKSLLLSVTIFIFCGIQAVYSETVTYSLSKNGYKWHYQDLANLSFTQMADKSYRLQLSNTPSFEADLALTFEQPNEWTNFNYKLKDPKMEVFQARERNRSGSYSAAFHGEDFLQFIPQTNSLFTKEAQDFSIDFWIYPTRLADGEQIFIYQAEVFINNRIEQQSIICAVEEGRLGWRFENIFFSADEKPIVVELRSSFMFKNTWHRHTLRYIHDLGLLELLDNGEVVAVAYANTKGEEDSEMYLPMWVEARNRIITVGAFAGYLDDFIIYPYYTQRLNFGRFINKGVLVTNPIDLDGANFKSADLIGDEPNAAQFRTYIRFDKYAPNLEDAEKGVAWELYDKNRTYDKKDNRFVQFKIEFYAGESANSSPILHDFVVNYELIPPPPRPGQVKIEKQGNGVLISWQPILGGDIAGYKLYFGEYSGDYFGRASNLASPIDVGNLTSYYIEGLTPGKLYYFAITAYDFNTNRQESAFSPEKVFLL